MANFSYGGAYQGGAHGPAIIGNNATSFPEQMNSLQSGMKRLSVDTKRKSGGLFMSKPARKVSITTSPSRNRTLSSERPSKHLALESYHFEKGNDWSMAEGRFVDQNWDVMTAQIKKYRKDNSVSEDIKKMSYGRRESLDRLVYQRNLRQKDPKVRWAAVSIKTPQGQTVTRSDGSTLLEKKSMDVIIALNPASAKAAGEKLDTKQPMKPGDFKSGGKGDSKDSKDGKGSKGLKTSSDADRRGDYLNNNELFTQGGAPLDHGRPVQDLPVPELLQQQQGLPFFQPGGLPGFHQNQGMPMGAHGSGGIEILGGDQSPPPPLGMHGHGHGQPQFHSQGQQMHPDFLPVGHKQQMHGEPVLHHYSQQQQQQFAHDDRTESSGSEFYENSYSEEDDEWGTNTSVDSNPPPMPPHKHRGSLKQGRRSSMNHGEPLYRQHTRGYSRDEEPQRIEQYRPSNNYRSGQHGNADLHVAKTHRRRDSFDHHRDQHRYQQQTQRRIEPRGHHSPPRSPMSVNSFEMDAPKQHRRGRGMGHAHNDMDYPGQMPLTRGEREAEKYIRQQESRPRAGGKEHRYSSSGGGGGGFPAYAQGGGGGGGHYERHPRR